MFNHYTMIIIRKLFIAGVMAVSIILLPVSSVEAARTIKFSGRDWNVKTGYSAPGKNFWTDSSNAVFVDSRGALHLKIVNIDGTWHSTEVSSPSLGYGVYEFDIESSIANLDMNTVASPFIYVDDEHEIDIEYTKWKVPEKYNTFYSIQPVKTTGSHRQYVSNPKAGIFTARMTWQPDKILLQTIQRGVVLNSSEYSGEYNFAPGDERVYLNHWLIDGSAPTDKKTKDFIVRAFRFQPYTGPGAIGVISSSMTKEEYIKQWREKMQIEQAARRAALIEKIGIEAYLDFVAEMQNTP